MCLVRMSKSETLSINLDAYRNHQTKSVKGHEEINYLSPYFEGAEYGFIIASIRLMWLKTSKKFP